MHSRRAKAQARPCRTGVNLLPGNGISAYNSIRSGASAGTGTVGGGAGTRFGVGQREFRVNGLRVIGDIGGTNARFAVAENGIYGELKHVEVSKYASLHDALTDYHAALPAARRPTEAALAVAGPVMGDVVALTNLSWQFSISDLRQSLGFSSLSVVNDFAATALSVPHLPKRDVFTVGPSFPDAAGAIGVIGPGTGLGVGGVLPKAGQWLSLAGEGGHCSWPTVTAEEDAILRVLRSRWGHVSAERVLSGAGLVNLYEALCAIEDVKPKPMTPADVTDRAINGTDPLCAKAFAHFCSILGTVAGDLALTLGATGGIYIAGGILLRFKDAFAASGFRARFESKGRLSGFLTKIPTHLILEESPALLGLANMALEG
jgi:glucokinase